jgi:hypothetical protein
MKNKDSYLPLFFLCWAFLYSPLALLSVFPLEEKEDVVGPKSIGSGAMRERQRTVVVPEASCNVFLYDGLKGHIPATKQGNNLVVPFFYRYKQFTYELK